MTRWNRWFFALLVPALLAASGCGSCGSCDREPAREPSACASCSMPLPEPEPPCCEAGTAAAVAVAAAATRPAEQGGGEESTTEYRFPADGGALLLKLLPPKVTLTALAERTVEPRRKNGPASVENPVAQLAPAIDGVLRLPPLTSRGFPAPRLTVIESLAPTAAPDLPSAVVFPEVKKVKAERLDPAVAPPLPILGQLVTDRATLDDATRTMSFDAVIVAPIPERQAPAPFTRQSIPDPFENRRVVRVVQPIEEESVPVVVPPRAPKP